ncbi:MAG: hypothetical protein V1754_10145, partial [Pseudomonadota bacterium]
RRVKKIRKWQVDGEIMAENLKINIGCGQAATSADGWVNIDKSPNAWLAKHKGVRWVLKTLRMVPSTTYKTNYREDVQVVDVQKRGLPVEEGTASWIYCSHLIGSMNRDEALCLLKECKRALKSGGRIRIVTPDLQALAKRWGRSADAYLKGNREYFMVWDNQELAIGDCFVKSLELELFTRTKLNRLQRLFDYPLQYFYDFESLELVLLNAGFSKVEKLSYRDSTMPDVDRLDQYPDALHVEGVR